MQCFTWTGAFVSGSTACAVVKYHGPTNTKGSRWIATIKRGGDETFRASASFLDGPLVAAIAATRKFGANWTPISCHNIDSDTYCIGF